MGDHIIPIHPEFDSPEFLAWVNLVIKHRHGSMREIHDIMIMTEEWELEQLLQIKRTNSVALNPRREDEPIIILRGLKRDYLLDGNRRINTWKKRSDRRKHVVKIVCPVYGGKNAL
jgi:hypothetical protein